jgi:hypothetical protein
MVKTPDPAHDHGVSTLKTQITLTLALLFCAAKCLGQIDSQELPAWRAVSKGIELLGGRAPRAKVIEQWDTAITIDPKGRVTSDVARYLPRLRQLLEEEKRLAADTANPSELPMTERLEYYITRFIDVRGLQMSQPGKCRTVGVGPDSAYSDAVVKLGRSAIPSLLRHLNDERLTRSIGSRNSYFHVLAVQDVALQCIEAIVGIRFFEERSSVDYLSMGPPERTRHIIDEITSWWERNKERAPLDGFVDRLTTLTSKKAHLYRRLEVLRKIEAIDRRAVPSTTVLRSWVPEAEGKPEEMAVLAMELGKRGDKSLLPQMRRMVMEVKDYVPRECVWLLLRYGQDQDYTLLASKVREDIRKAKRDEEKLGISRVVLECAPGQLINLFEPVKDGRLVPILVDLLVFRRPSGVMGGPSGPVSITVADEAMQSLVYLTKHSEGYRPDAPEKERFAAMERWLAWWRRTSKSRSDRKPALSGASPRRQDRR